MFDLIGLFVIMIATPIIVINGMKYFKTNISKTLKILVLILLVLELARFFYTAQLYEKAYMPADKVTFTFISFLVVVGLFAVFNNARFQGLCKKVLVLTVLAPVIMAVIYPHIYSNELDTFAVVKGLYFAEVGVLTTLTYLFMKEEASQITVKSLFGGLGFVAIYIFANVMRNIFWIPNMEFNLTWFLCMISIALSVVAMFFTKSFFEKNIK